MAKNKNPLLLEAHRINYRLRSTFFFRRIHEYQTFDILEDIHKLIPYADNFNWQNRKKWKIAEDAYAVVEHNELALIQVFCHPRVIRGNPKLIAYYRNISVISQKAVKYLTGIDTKKIEDGTLSDLSEPHAFSLAELFNEHISLIIESAFGKLREAELQGLLLASTGAQIDGSWRNGIGDEAKKAVQRILIREAIRRDIFCALIRRNDNELIPLENGRIEKALKNIRLFKGAMLSTQREILFSSEPDISILDHDGATLLVIEVKGGTDPAGALERYGAAKKSLEASLRHNKKVRTCVIASCITPEVGDRMKKDRTISRYFNLTEVISHETRRNRFLNYVFSFIQKG
ncbi:hypothetical protein DENIS_3917 [Desulfonema ishimotonii]|uniref:XcyI family restriction endonuclease n=2 Tax=Desulfonema ishimotonii TaxID=45657 RepID=A0A401G170_9BACT|nr:hypothetical protein DENIS_3917 [Desulfonema ishimotonii]